MLLDKESDLPGGFDIFRDILTGPFPNNGSLVFSRYDTYDDLIGLIGARPSISDRCQWISGIFRDKFAELILSLIRQVLN